MSTVGSYPTRDEHSHRWEQLAREIAASGQHLAENAHPPDSAPKGALIVLGSGIEGVSFTMGAEPYLRMADKVFYCVSNRPTQVWLQTLRPDAYDLYVFYEDTKPRYHTYVQMTEAILHYVRKGMRVVTVYYGHPGVFVFSTHRAIEIARREGHYAVMKPGISALDCLCADLGVDPAFPGMQMFEATDALARRRRLDTTAHVVLWQVGLIGIGGYRRRGFVNDRFPLLVEYLEEIYGPDHEVTNYVAARYPTFEPTIAVHQIGRLMDPRVRATVSALSTFYIPPKLAAPTDAEMAVRLGMIQPGQRPIDHPPLRQISLYAARELKAIEEFDHFRVPEDYEFQDRTRAAEFLIELGQNIALQDLYRQAPEQAVSEESFPGLSNVERHLLARRDQELAQLAARGWLVKLSPDERFVVDLHNRRDLASGLRAALATDYQRADAAAELDAWISSQGYQATLARLPATNGLVNASMLLPWTGVYSTPDAGVVLTVIGGADSNGSSLVYVNESPIVKFTFHDATLMWSAADGNPHHGELTFQMPRVNGSSAFIRTASGKFWTDDDGPSDANLFVSEVVPAGTPLSLWTGRYTTRVTRDGAAWDEGPGVEVVTPRPDQDPNVPRLFVDGRPIDDARLDDRTVQWRSKGGDNRITFSHDSEIPQRHLLSGQVDGLAISGANEGCHHAPFEGAYDAYVWSANQWRRCGEFHYDGRTVRLDTSAFEGAVFHHGSLQWAGFGGSAGNGRIRFFIDPVTQSPKFIGSVWGAGGRPDQANFLGVGALDPTAAQRLARSGSDGIVPPRVRQTLATIGLEARDPSYHLLWSRWQRARFTCRLLNHLVPRMCEVVGRKPRSQTTKGED